jgi:hypothetical protein
MSSATKDFAAKMLLFQKACGIRLESLRHDCMIEWQLFSRAEPNDKA